MSDLDLKIDFKLNTPEAKAEADQVRNAVKGVGFDAEAAAKKALATVASTKSSFNGLQNSINQISRELPAFTFSAQTGFLAISNNIPMLADEIGRLRQKNAELTASGGKAVPIWKQLAGGLFSWGTAISLGITLITIFGKEVGNFVTSLFKGNEAIDAAKERLKSLNDTLKSESFQKTIAGVSELRINLDLAKKGMADKEAVVKQYNQTIGKTAGQVKDLDGVEQGIAKNADNYIKMTLYKAAANLQLAEAAKRAAEIQENAAKSAEDFANVGDKITSGLAAGAAGGGSQFGVGKFNQNQYEQQLKADGEKRKASRKKQLEDEQKSFEQNAQSLLTQAAKSAKGMGGLLLNDTNEDSKTGQKEANALAQALERREDLLNKISDLDAEYSRKSFTKDEEELQALKDKFSKARRIIEDFNNDPKNSKVAKVSVAGLEPLEQKAVADLTYRQDTEKLKTSLTEQRELYEKFEDFKLNVGNEAAENRYKKELDVTKTYLQKLKDERAKLGDTNLTGGETEREKWLEEQIKEGEAMKRESDNKIYADAYEAAKSHTQRLLDVDLEYRRRVAALGETATAEQIVLLAQQRDVKKQAINAEAIDSETNWANMFGSFERMSTEAVKKYLDDVQARVDADFKAGKITVTEHINRTKTINAAYDQFGGSNVFAKVPIALKKWVDKVKEFGITSKAAKDEFVKVAATVADAADGAQSILGDVNRTLDKLGASQGTQDTLNSITGMVGGIGDIAKGIASGNPIDIVKGSVAFLTNAIDLFNNKDKKLQKQIDGYQRNLKELGRAYEQLERNINNSVGESYYADSTKAIENLKNQQKELQASINDERSKKKADGGKIDEWQRQLDAIPGKIDDINKAVSEMLVQTTFKDFSNQLADAFSDAFSAGEHAAKNFDDVFNNVIKNAIKNSLKLKLIEPVVKSFTDALTDHMKANNNSVVGFDFAAWKTILKGAGDNMTKSMEGLEEYFKEDILDEVKDSPLAGAVKGITADQADLLAGQFGGMRLAQLEANQIKRNGFEKLFQNGLELLNSFKTMLLVQYEIAENTKRTATNTDRLEAIEISLKSIDRKMDTSGNAIKAGGI